MQKNHSLDGLLISYFDQNEKSKQAIVFIHGNSLSFESFQQQLNSEALKSYRLIAITLPGHGSSSPDSVYNVPRFSRILSRFIRVLGLEKYILVGHSLGGHIAIESLELTDPAGVMIIGTPPVTKPMSSGMFHQHPALGLLYKNDLSASEVSELLTALGSEDLDQFNKTDPSFRMKFAESLGQSLFQDEVELLKNFEGAKSVILGSHDPLINSEYLRSLNFEIETIHGGHSVHRQNPEAFNAVLRDFAVRSFAEPFIPSFETMTDSVHL